jgi:hypothetical protein
MRELRATYNDFPESKERMYQEQSRVNRLLRRYRGHREIGSMDELGMSYFQTVRLGEPVNVEVRQIRRRRLDDPAWEWEAAAQVEVLAARGFVDRLGQCSNPKCGLWLYKRKKDQVCCSDECRFEYHHNSERYKEPRKKQRRDNYWSKKMLDQGGAILGRPARKWLREQKELDFWKEFLIPPTTPPLTRRTARSGRAQ